MPYLKLYLVFASDGSPSRLSERRKRAVWAQSAMREPRMWRWEEAWRSMSLKHCRPIDLDLDIDIDEDIDEDRGEEGVR